MDAQSALKKKTSVTLQVQAALDQFHQKVNNISFGEIHFFIRDGLVYRAEIKESMIPKENSDVSGSESKD